MPLERGKWVVSVISGPDTNQHKQTLVFHHARHVMNDQPHDRNENDEAADYFRFIQSLADEFRISVEQVLPIYEQELLTLRSNARVTTYLSVLTAKHVRDVLHDDKRRSEQ